MNARGDAPVVSVVMANHQAAPFIAAAIGSVLASTLADLELIVVDDASRDDGPAIARAIAARDGRVRVDVLPVNAGPAAARNRGLALARGRWVGIVDSDDLIEPDRFARLVAAAEDAGADVVADDLLIFDDGSDAAPRRFLKATDRAAPFRLDLADFLRRSELYGPEPPPGVLKPLIRRDRWLAAGVRYDERLRIAEDEHLIARLLLAGLTYLVVPEPGYRYRKHGASISHRLTAAAAQAMRDADRTLAADVLRHRPDLAPVCAARARALDKVVSFERMVAALKRRRPAAALRLAAANPAALALFRMPLEGWARRVTGRGRNGAIG